MGVHVPFQHYQYFDELLDAVVQEWNHLLREAWILLGKRWIPYPFQSNIHRLSREDQKRCLQGLAQRSRQMPTNFQQWIDFNFGQGIADLFLNPYNLTSI
jgi:protoporphyrinogen oxidase